MRAVRRYWAGPRVRAAVAAEDRDLARRRGGPRGFADPRHDDARTGDPGFAARRIITRRLSAVEGLAAVEIACFDKTGTLTLNDMSVVRLYWNETRARLVDEKFRTATGSAMDCTADRELARLLELAILCNDVELLDAAASDADGSATEMALVRAAIRGGLDVEAVRARHPRRATLERAEDRRYMVTVHDVAADQKLVIIKGDPSEVLALCRWRLHNGIVAPLED